MKTSLGVSNVSFGFGKAAREVLNSVFLHHCVQAGLDLAMVHPADITPYGEIPDLERALADDLVFNRREDATQRFIEHFEEKGETAAEESADPTAGMEPEEALHFHILRRREGGRRGLDRSRGREDRRRPDAQRRPAAGDEGGRRQVRRRRADPPVRAPVGRGDEEGGRPPGELPRPDRGLHEGHGGHRDRLRRRPRHRQVAGQHDPLQQRLHRRRPRQAGPDLEDPRGGPGARRDGDRPLGPARVDLQADAARRGRAPRARARVPRADRRGGDQPRLRPAHPLPAGQGLRRDLRARRLLLQGRLRGPGEDGPADRPAGPRRAGQRARGRRPSACATRGRRRPSCRPTTTPSARPRGPTTRFPSRRTGASTSATSSSRRSSPTSTPTSSSSSTGVVAASRARRGAS